MRIQFLSEAMDSILLVVILAFLAMLLLGVPGLLFRLYVWVRYGF